MYLFEGRFVLTVIRWSLSNRYSKMLKKSFMYRLEKVVKKVVKKAKKFNKW